MWGSPPPPPPSAAAPCLSVTDQTLRALPGLVEFSLRLKTARPRERDATAASLPSQPAAMFAANTRALLDSSDSFDLDAFVIEIDGPQHGATVPQFARTVRSVLSTLSNADPVLPVRHAADLDSRGIDVRAAQCLMPMLMADALQRDSTPAIQTALARAHARVDEWVSSTRWHFDFLGETFFVTTFAPCYDEHHPRYMFTHEAATATAAVGEGHDEQLAALPRKCYVLLQPELSFLRRHLSPDTPHTNWDTPHTERDRIRCAFRDAQRPFPVPATIAYPAAHFLVMPADAMSLTAGGAPVRWWDATPEQQY